MTLLRGNRVYLSAVTRADIAEIGRWYQDMDFTRLYDASPARPRTEQELLAWVEAEQKDRNTFFFAIRPSGEPWPPSKLIGIIDLSDILWNQGTAWLGIAIGDPVMRGHGYGIQATALILDYAFHELNLHRVQLSVFSYNSVAIGIYEKLGFTQEGRLREALQRNGQRHDMLYYGMLRPEWQAIRHEHLG